MNIDVQPKLSKTAMMWFMRLTKGAQTPVEDNAALKGLENRGLATSVAWNDGKNNYRTYKLTQLGLLKFAASGSIREVL